MAFALSGDRYLLGPQDFILRGRERPKSHAFASGDHSQAVTLGPEGLDFELAVGRFERSLLNQALALSGGNKARAADLLRIKRTTLLAKMKAFEERTPAGCLAR
jgi:DNA-binding NtrC family response regulator